MIWKEIYWHLKSSAKWELTAKKVSDCHLLPLATSCSPRQQHNLGTLTSQPKLTECTQGSHQLGNLTLALPTISFHFICSSRPWHGLPQDFSRFTPTPASSLGPNHPCSLSLGLPKNCTHFSYKSNWPVKVWQCSLQSSTPELPMALVYSSYNSGPQYSLFPGLPGLSLLQLQFQLACQGDFNDIDPGTHCGLSQLPIQPQLPTHVAPIMSALETLHGLYLFKL